MQTGLEERAHVSTVLSQSELPFWVDLDTVGIDPRKRRAVGLSDQRPYWVQRTRVNGLVVDTAVLISCSGKPVAWKNCMQAVVGEQHRGRRGGITLEARELRGVLQCGRITALQLHRELAATTL